MLNNEGLEKAIQDKRVDTLFRKNKVGLPGIFVFVFVFLYAYRDYDNTTMLAIWAGLVILIAVGQWLFMQHFFTHKEVQATKKWLHQLTFFSSSIALLIGSSVWLFYAPENMQQTFIIAILIIGSMFGSVIFAASYFPIHVAWSVPLAFPFSVLLLLRGDTEQSILGALFLLAGIPTALFLGWMMSKEYGTSLRLGFEKDVLLEDLKEQKEAAEKATKDKTHFLAAASHDLRQPHQALGLFVEALDHLETEPKKKEILSKTKQAFKAMSALLDQLLDISKLDSADIQANKQPVRLQPLLHQVVMEHMGEAEEKGVELRLRATEAVALVDASMLVRIVSNLITNAICYTKEGGVLLAVRQRQGGLRLDVLDTGCGIPQDKQADIFKEFTQLENPERDREKGLGLGLAIVQRLTKLMDTEVSLVSKVNKGSCFSIPLEAASDEIITIPKPHNHEVVSLHGFHVVVIDDDEIALESMHTILHVWGCDVHIFNSEDECLQHLEQEQRYPDMLIVDFRLRNHKNGLDAVEAIRNFCKKEVSSLIVTGDTAPESILRIQEAGLPFLHKPVNPKELYVFLGRVKSEL